MRQLLLLRHAKSSHKDSSLADYDRPLARRGRKDCRRIGRWLKESGLEPDLILSSPARRTRQTAKRVVKHLNSDFDSIQWEEAIYDARVKTLFKLLAKVPDDFERVMVIGHHQALEEMILRKSKWSEIPANPKLIPTAAVAVLKIEGSWSEIKKADASLKMITRPRDLRQQPASAE